MNEETITNISKKIEEKQLDFSSEEKVTIAHNIELFKYFIKCWASDPDTLYKHMKTFNIVTKQIEEIVALSQSEELINQLLIQIEEYLIVIEDIQNQYDIDNGIIKSSYFNNTKLRKYIEKKLTDKNYIVQQDSQNFIPLNLLLDTKRYDLIDYQEIDSIDLLERIISMPLRNEQIKLIALIAKRILFHQLENDYISNNSLKSLFIKHANNLPIDILLSLIKHYHIEETEISFKNIILNRIKNN